MESESTPTAIRIPSNAPDESSLGTFGDNWPGLQLTPGSPWNPAVPKLTPSSKTKFEDIKLLVENCFANGVDLRDMLVHAGWITKRDISPVETLHYKEISPERESLKQATYDLLKEASTPNWDGEGALPLTAETVAIAQKLVDRFPSYVASPDVPLPLMERWISIGSCQKTLCLPSVSVLRRKSLLPAYFMVPD